MLTVINNKNGEQRSFDHSDPVIAFSFLKAQKLKQISFWHCQDRAGKAAYLGKITHGEFSWSWGDWSIRYPQLNKQELQKAFLASGGTLCPRCCSSSIDGSHIEIIGSVASQEQRCTDCDLDWNAAYILTGIEMS